MDLFCSGNTKRKEVDAEALASFLFRSEQCHEELRKLPCNLPRLRKTARWVSANNWRRHGFRILLPLPCLTVDLDPTDEKIRLASQTARKTEISRDFSVFFDPIFFRISIYPFSIFLRVEGFELPKTHFFQNFITNESNTKDLNPRCKYRRESRTCTEF